MLPVGFEPTTPAVERPKTYALDRAATGTGSDELTTIIPVRTVPAVTVDLFQCTKRAYL